MYTSAMSDYAGGSYACGRFRAFRSSSRRFRPSTRADDAQQYIGEAEFSQNHFAEAIAAYNLVIQNYPKGDQVPWAYFKRGLAQSRLGQTANARVSFETVVKQFPETEAGVMALSRLQSLDSTPPPPATSPRRP
jgi:TolA-binding protein